MKTGTRITSKGQVVIPKAVRDRLHWPSGTRLEVDETSDGAVTLRAIRGEDDPIDRALGFLTEGDPVGDMESEHRAEVAADERPRRR